MHCPFDGALSIGGNSGIPQPAPIFALLPALVNAGPFLDLNSISAAKLFKSGAQPLSQTFPFLDPSDIQVFLLDLLKTKTESKVGPGSLLCLSPLQDSLSITVCCPTIV
jgi:hypothetical protein